MKINEELGVVAKRVLQTVDPSCSLKDFDWVRLGPFAQETEDWTDPETGEFYKASMDYFSHLTGRRISDGTDFAVRIRLEHEVVDGSDSEKKLAYVESCLANAVMSLASYANCSCVVGVPCERHSRD